ncbi:MAG: A/G-specific adenine glycosylase [Candidatus Brocadiia bacterium]
MKDEKFEQFGFQLLQWYSRNRRELPWRDDPSPYEVWVSEVMLQQTVVGSVIGRFEQWMSEFPGIRDVAEAEKQEVLSMWEGLGYYQRARHLHEAAQVIVSKYGGRIPCDREALLDLPGIGPYIASAIRSLAFAIDDVALDANLKRVFMRLLALPGMPQDSSVRKTAKSAAQQAMPPRRSADFNQGLMDFGTAICRPGSPLCGKCFASGDCAAYQEGVQEEIPPGRKRKIKKITTVLAIFLRRSEIYIQKRPLDGLFGGLWEFPGGKVEADEGLKEALKREIREELGVECEPGQKLPEVMHYYTRFEATLQAFLCPSPPVLPTDETHRWIGLVEIKDYPMPSANRRLVQLIEETIL